MSLAPGVRLGAYEVLGLIGAGGMGEVYKARDTRLERTVAIKVLSERFAADSERRLRFTREARSVAALNHPHICVLHDVAEAIRGSAFGIENADDAGPIRFLVMEHLEGQTLADRLVRGPLPIAEVLRYAVELADALDHAHRRGLVHRDLKPGNVMMTKAGAKLLDFGLSRLQSNPDLLALSTIAAAAPTLTAEGTVLGTFPYMAPEQLAGREADARSDIFAFGALAYEMATGRRAFAGATAASVIGAVLHTDPPPLSTLQPRTPPALDRIVSRCLAKDPDDRWQTARDLMLELKWIAEHDAPPSADRRRDRKLGLIASATAATAIVAIAALAFIAVYVGRPPAADATVRLSFSPPEGLKLADVGIGGLPTISPDGTRFAFVATGADSRQLLWTRPVGSLDAQLLPGTDGAEAPFWSPDGQFIGFFAQRKLRKIAVSGGPVQALCDAVQPRGGTWNRLSVIVFSANSGHQLYRVSAGGGVATPIAADGKNEERYWPSFLPDGRHFVYRGRPQQHGIFVAALDAPGAKLLLDGYLSAAYSPPGYLVGLTGSSPGAASGTVLAHAFDASTLEITGQPFPVAELVAYRVGTARAAFSVSESGTLVYGSVESLAARLTWFDRSGNTLRNVGGAVTYNSPSLSPNEKTIAVERFDPEAQSEDIWLIESARDIPSRFTSYPNSDTAPVWSPDGSRIVFASPRGTPPNLYQKTVSEAGSEELLEKSIFNKHPTDWSRDGRFLVFSSLDPNNQWDLWLLPMSGGRATGHAVPFLRTPYNEVLGQFSPDGRWLAYVSDESGTNEVYVRSFPQSGDQRRISASGGNAPRWRGDGRELFYLAADATLMAVSMTPGSNFQASAPMTLFKTRIPGVGTANNWGYEPNYTVTRDGQRFLINTVTEEHAVPPTIVLNWPAVPGRR